MEFQPENAGQSNDGLDMKTVYKYLNREELFHVNLEQALRRNLATVEIFRKDGILLRMVDDPDVFMLSAADKQAALELLDACDGVQLLLMHQDFVENEANAWFGLNPLVDVYQAAYLNPGQIPMKNPGAQFVRLSQEQIEQAMELYQEAEGLAFQRCDEMIGAFIDDQLAGFVGTQQDGSLGVFLVRPDLRGKGIGTALYSAMANVQISRGMIPFAHIPHDSEAALALHKKMGFRMTRRYLHWYIRE